MEQIKTMGKFFNQYRGKARFRPSRGITAALLPVFLTLLPWMGGDGPGSPWAQAGPPDRLKVKLLPDFIVRPMEILDSDRVPKGTFILIQPDYIACAGPGFKGKPAPSGKFGQVVLPDGTRVDAGEWNNRIVRELRGVGPRDTAKLQAALRKLQMGTRADPLFFPFLYNMGRVYLIMKLPEKAILWFNKARGAMPRYAGVYMNLGHAFARAGDERAAVAAYRTAAGKNPFVVKPLVALGNFYLERGSRIQAAYYFRRILRNRPDQSNAKIGLARLLMLKGDMLSARNMLNSVPVDNLDGTPRNDYDRSLHYYQAVIASELRDYNAAVKQFDRLLKFPEDPFFLNIAIGDIRRRREIVKRLADVDARR